MIVSIPFDTMALDITVPETSVIYRTTYPRPQEDAAHNVMDAVRHPIGGPPLKTALRRRRKGKVVLVVSDITRPIPYAAFLPALLSEIHEAGVSKEEILFLVATGMHRPSTTAERSAMFGDIAGEYDIEDHDAEGTLAEIPGRSLSGRRIFINKHFLDAGFRITTGLAEPHFMAGFSGGRKSVCPGLVALETIQSFHSYEFLNSPKATNGNLDGNPCHLEAISVAKMAGVDFSLNVVLDARKQVVRAFAGDLEAAHQEACDFVKTHACPQVLETCDVVLAGCGGYPLDATFYQCIKGIVAAIPAVKTGGMVIAVGGCREGMGSEPYQRLMRAHANDFNGFLEKIRSSATVTKDQWQFQMQTRALEKVGEDGILIFSHGINDKDGRHLAARHRHVSRDSAKADIQNYINELSASGSRFAIIPEGPYCTPVYAPSSSKTA